MNLGKEICNVADRDLSDFIHSSASSLGTPFLEPGGKVGCTHPGIMYLLDGFHLSGW